MTFKELIKEQLDAKDFTAEINTIKARLDQMVQNVTTVDGENKKLLQNNQQLKNALDRERREKEKSVQSMPKYQRQGVGTTRSIEKSEGI